MDASRVALMRQVLSSTPWVDRTRSFARTLRTSTRTERGLLLVGTPEEEPWHLAAHIDDESRFAGIPELSPVLVRHQVPANAPAHLSIGLDRIQAATRGETLFVVAPSSPTEAVLSRVDDARGRGATIMSMHCGDDDLQSLAHESLILPPTGLVIPELVPELVPSIVTAGTASLPTNFDVDASSLSVSFDVLEHLVSCAVGETAITAPAGTSAARHGFRDRLGRMLDAIAGPSASRD